MSAILVTGRLWSEFANRVICAPNRSNNGHVGFARRGATNYPSKEKTNQKYENAATIAKEANKNGTTLKEEALKLGLVSEEDFGEWVRPEDMTRTLS